MREGDYLAGEGNKVFVRTDQATLTQVQLLIATLDRTPVTLLITVRQGTHGSEQDHHLDGEIRLSEGVMQGESTKFQNTMGSDNPRNKLSISISGNHLSTQDRNSTEQAVTVVEGHEAHFYISQQIPTINYQHGIYGALQPGVEYRSALSGFSVIGQVNGEQIQLTIRGQQEKFAGDDTLNGQQIETTLITRSGEWHQLGENKYGESLEQRGTLLRTDLRKSQHQSILIKAEKINENDH